MCRGAGHLHRGYRRYRRQGAGHQGAEGCGEGLRAAQAAGGVLGEGSTLASGLLLVVLLMILILLLARDPSLPLGS